MTITAPGIYRSLSFSDYVRIPAYNASAVKRLVQHSPKHMRYFMEHGNADTPAMALGRAVHAAVFEPETMLDRYVVWRGGIRRGEKWEQFKADSGEREILTEAEHEHCMAIRAAVVNHKAARELVRHGDNEVSFVWRALATGLLCKGRADHVIGSTLVDLKTASDVRPFWFQRQADRLLYHMQLAAYRDGLETLGHKIERVVIIAVESAAPHDVVLYDLPPRTIRAGLAEWFKALQRIAWCEKQNEWPGIADQPFELEVFERGEVSGIEMEDEQDA